eukprot:TRINITY_DN526_c0_g1_i1.p1 TRINITY_DN526_c0_g1~~TRINITY_DN526_c0_g1_i1.p1  ORF type:complete len:332 (+),score=71.73 TRINITY_DN526_c0_g1_i1:466-1461(+)
MLNRSGSLARLENLDEERVKVLHTTVPIVCASERSSSDGATQEPEYHTKGEERSPNELMDDIATRFKEWAKHNIPLKGTEQELDQLLPMSIEAAKVRLKEGNQRFINGSVTGFFANIALSLDAGRQTQNIDYQKPWACVVACSDSRVAPEVIFDTGLRDLFVTRIAGNLADSLVLGSLEYAVTKFKKTVVVEDDDGVQEKITDGSVKLIVVLGHQECGAIKAACDALDHPGHVQGNVGELVKQVFDSANRAKHVDDIAYDFLTYGEAPPRHLSFRDKAVQRAVYFNVQNVMADLEAKSETIRNARQAGQIEIVGYIFDLDSRHLIKVPHKD